MSDEINLVCNLDAIADRDAHVVVSERVFGAVLETRETPDGYEFKLPVDRLHDVAVWMSNERLCCPFFDFSTDIEAGSDHMWLSLGGSQEIKAFVKADIIEQI